MKDNDYEQYDGEVYTGNYQKELEREFKRMIEQRVTNTEPNVDQVALECAAKIMSIINVDFQETQMKARIQCMIIDALEKFI